MDTGDHSGYQGDLGQIGSSPVMRREWIADEALREGFVSARDLADRFGVSVMTIYRDLEDLQERQVVRRERGGATAQPSGVFESDVRYRILRFREEKLELCKRAIEEVESGQAVMLDDSTSTLPLAKMMHSRAPLTVMTNFRVAIADMIGQKGVRVVCLGGEYLATHDSYTGLLCEDAIRAVRPDVFFASTSAICGETAFHQEQEMVRIKRAMMSVSGRSILLVDHSKFGKVAALKLARLDEFDLIITDSETPDESLREIEQSGVLYEVVNVPKSADSDPPDQRPGKS